MWWEDVTREFDLVKSEEKKNNYMGRSAPVIPCQAMGRWEGEGIKYGTVSDWWGSSCQRVMVRNFSCSSYSVVEATNLTNDGTHSFNAIQCRTSPGFFG